LQERMKAAGLTTDEQHRFAETFTGEGAAKRLRMVPFLMQQLQAGGVTDRELFQVLPSLVRHVDAGGNQFSAVAGTLNALHKRGMRADLAGLRSSPQDRQTALGAALLGLSPDMDPNTLSRLPAGGQNGLTPQNMRDVNRMGHLPPNQNAIGGFRSIPVKPDDIHAIGKGMAETNKTQGELFKALASVANFASRVAADQPAMRQKIHYLIQFAENQGRTRPSMQLRGR
ncbi:MAG TPA: hypothetical protein VFT74_06100, partial [Isosphaeraceae bacterium]|nr:hypothetical protein [Isosphaeraceae bacterium]